MRCVYNTFCVITILNELLAIMYATVASNSLTRVAAKPAASVFDLIQRNYELSWVATNVHFIVWIWRNGHDDGAAAISSKIEHIALWFGLFSIDWHEQYCQCWRGGRRRPRETLGSNIFSLGLRYIILSVKSVAEKKSVMGCFSLYHSFTLAYILCNTFGTPKLEKNTSQRKQQQNRCTKIVWG